MQKLKGDENLIDKVAFYSPKMEQWFVGKKGFEDYMETSGSLRTHGAKEPQFEKLKSFTYNPDSGDFTLEDEDGRMRNFNPEKYRIKLRDNI